VPDGQRPVYCPECLKRYRAERSERQRLLQSSPSQLTDGISLKSISKPDITSDFKKKDKDNNGH